MSRDRLHKRLFGQGIRLHGRSPDHNRPFPVPPLSPQGLTGAPFPGTVSPRRLVIVRLQAFGDTVITLPALAALRDAHPACRIEVITDLRSAALFEARAGLDRVWSFDARAPHLNRALAVARLVRSIRRDPLEIDAVIDLQRCRWSRLLIGLLRAPHHVRYDRLAPRSALTRYLEAFAWVGLPRLEPVYEPRIRPEVRRRGEALLEAAGFDPARPLICLNPAGGWPTKQWPLERFAALGRRLVAELDAQILLLGTGAMAPRVGSLLDGLMDLGGAGKASPAGGSPGPASRPDVVDLIDRTGAGELMAALARATLVISEDSGLMHLAWTQGVPTLALFGSSRWTWSRPEGPHSDGFYSEDLPCGACMQPDCQRGDRHCLDRVSVDAVLDRARALIASGRRG